MRPGKFRDINIGVKIIPVENHATLSPSTEYLLRGITIPKDSTVAIVSEQQRGREIARILKQDEGETTPRVSILRANALFEDTINAHTLILWPSIHLGKEVGFRAVKQIMTTHNYSEVAPAHIRMLLKLAQSGTYTPKRVILITTLSFMTCLDEQYVNLRKAFLSQYRIMGMSVSNDCIDNNNTMITLTADAIMGTQCALNMSLAATAEVFVAELCKDTTVDTIDKFDCTVYPRDIKISIDLNNPLRTIAYEWHEFVNYKSRYVVFSRYVDNDANHNNQLRGELDLPCDNTIPTNLYLNSVDCAATPISMEIKPPVMGKSTDRMSCTIVANVRILPYVDRMLCDKFNEFITSMRNKYCSLFLVNFRGVGANIQHIGSAQCNLGPRKRIPYNAAYAILGRFFDEIMDKGITGNLPKLIQARNQRDPQFERLMSNYKKSKQTNTLI